MEIGMTRGIVRVGLGLGAALLGTALLVGSPSAQERPPMQPVVAPLATQRQVGSTILPELDDLNWIVVKMACQKLGRLGPPAQGAMPRLLDVLVRPGGLPAASPPPPTGPWDNRPRRPGPGELTALQGARAAAATARMRISLDVTVDQPLYPRLDKAGKVVLIRALAEAARSSGASFDGVQAHAQEASELLLQHLEGLSSTTDMSKVLGWSALTTLTHDGVGEPVRGRALELLRRFSRSDDDELRQLARLTLEPPERYGQALPDRSDTRETNLFRPRSSLAATTMSPSGRLAVSRTRHASCFMSSTFHDRWTYTLHIWETASGREIDRIEGLSEMRMAPRFSADGKQLLVGPMRNRHGGGLVLRTGDGSLLRIAMPYPREQLRHSAFLPDGRVLTADGRRLSLWDFEAGEQVASLLLEGELSGATCLAVGPQGKQALIGSADGHLRRITIDDDGLTLRAVLLEPTPADAERKASLYLSGLRQVDHPIPRAVVIMPDGCSALYADDLGELVLLDLFSREVGRRLPCPPAGAECLAVSDDGSLALAGIRGTWIGESFADPADLTICLYDLTTGKALTQLTGMLTIPRQVGFGLDSKGRTTVVALASNALREWTLEPEANR